MRCLFLLIAVMILSGCGPNSSVNRTYRITTDGGSKVELNFYLDGLELASNADTSATQATDLAGAAGQGVAALGGKVDGVSSSIAPVSTTTTTSNEATSSTPGGSFKVQGGEVIEDAAKNYQTRFHHTTTGSSDGGKSLMMCPNETEMFDSCSSSGVNIPYHGLDDGRIAYWNRQKTPKGDIVCKKDGKSYKYLADKTIVYGNCDTNSTGLGLTWPKK